MEDQGYEAYAGIANVQGSAMNVTSRAYLQKASTFIIHSFSRQYELQRILFYMQMVHAKCLFL